MSETGLNLQYRPLTANDLPAVFEVRASNIENAISIEELAQVHGITPESLAREMRHQVFGWVCEADDTMAGFCMADNGSGEITVLSVRPEFEGNGIGQVLLQRTGEVLFAAGHDRIWLTSNPDPAVRAHGFYRHLGWRPDGRMVRTDEVLVLERPD